MIGDNCMSQETLHDRCVAIAGLIICAAEMENVPVQTVADEIMKVMNN